MSSAAAFSSERALMRGSHLECIQARMENGESCDLAGILVRILRLDDGWWPDGITT